MPVPSATNLSTFSKTANASSYTFSTTLPAANALALAWLEHHGSALQSITSIVGGGAQNGWTSIISVTFNPVATPLDRVEVWRSLSATPTSASVVTVTLSGTVSDLQGGITQFSNVSTTGTNGANAVAQSVSSRADTVSVLTCTLAAFGNANNVPYGSFSWATINQNRINPGASFVELGEANSGEFSGVNSQWTSANTQKVPATLTAGTRNAAGVALEIVGDIDASAEDVLIRVGNISTTEHSGMITSAFSSLTLSVGGGIYRRRRLAVFED